jgi:cytochrome c-type biogenesis protein CcmH
MLFLLIVSTLILLAFLFILPPLWRKQKVKIVDLDKRNIEIAQHRLAELKENRLTGGITQAQYDEQFADLEQALSDDLDIVGPEIHVTTQSKWIIYIVALGIPLLAGSLYFMLGNYQAVSHTAEMSVDPEATKLLEINKMVLRLAEKMKAKPDDAQGWLILGRSYKALEQYPQAADAFANAYRLLGNQAEAMLLYADALAYVNNRNLAGKPSELVYKALALEPDNLNALWLGGMAKAQEGDAPAAIKLWKKLEATLPPGSDSQQEIKNLLSNLAKDTSQGQVQKEPEAPEQAKVSNFTLSVQVSLAPKLQKAAAAEDTVFIYAQALSGPKMPLAIVRKHVSDLPLAVSLNDSMAMMPNMKLSNFASVKLLARISKSGNAMTQPNDLIGIIEQVDLTDKSIHKIIINTPVK